MPPSASPSVLEERAEEATKSFRFRAPISFNSKQVNESSSLSSQPLKLIRRSRDGGALAMASSGLRHVESLASFPYGAGKITCLNVVILGESLASEENDLVFPSDDFSRQALVPSPPKVFMAREIKTGEIVSLKKIQMAIEKEGSY